MISLGQRMHSYNIIVSKWYQQRQVRLVEDGWVDFVKKLRSKGAVVYGFCSMPIHLVNIEEKRYLEAKDLDIIFTSKINGKEVLEIEKHTISVETHHMNCDYSGYEGKKVTGKTETVILRGQIAIENENCLLNAGHGQFIKRGKTSKTVI